MTRVLLIGLSLGVTSCAPSPPVVGPVYFAQAVPFCEMMANRDKYVDREVLVSGLYIETDHRREMYGPGCNARSIALKGDVSLPVYDRRARAVIKAAQRQISGARIPVVAKGLLRKYRGPGVVFAADEVWLERTQIIAADGAHVQRPPK